MNQQDLEVAKEMGDEDEVEYLSSQGEDFKDDIKNLVSNYLKTDDEPKGDEPEDDDGEWSIDQQIANIEQEIEFADKQAEKTGSSYWDKESARLSNVLKNMQKEKEAQDGKKDAPKGPKYEPAGAADAWQVRTNVMNSIGRDKFRRLSYGDLEAEYAAEFKKLGFEKIDGKWQKKVSENHELKDQYIRFFER